MNKQSAQRKIFSSQFPNVINNKNGQAARFPIGGIGTGSISLDVQGRLRDWEIFSRPDKGKSPRHSLVTIWASNHGKPQARIVEGIIPPPYQGARGLNRNNLPGLPRFQSTELSAVYPFANINFVQPDFPLSMSLEAFNPMVPLDLKASSLPIVILSYTVKNKTRHVQKCCLAYSLTNFMDQQYCQYNRIVQNKNLKGVQLLYQDSFSGHKIDGGICISVDDPNAQLLPNWDNSEDRDEGMAFWNYFTAKGRLPEPQKEFTASTASVGSRFLLKPGQSRIVRFYITWHFKRRTLGWSGWEKSNSKYSGVDVGNYYAAQYRDAWDAMTKIVPQLPVFEKRSRFFVEILKTSSFPPEVLDSLFANMSTLRTQTIFQTADGEFHGFEGCNDETGCCPGDCNHVYNYELATSILFPQIAKSLINTALFQNTDHRGATAFRTLLPTSRKRMMKVAADGTMGTICRLYRLWQITGDDRWLKKCWPVVKKILYFTWSQGGWDADRDGVLEGVQHNTYDCEFYGPNPLCTGWYLAALGCAAKMATYLSEKRFADKCSHLLRKGSKWVDEHLFNGEYYRQKVNPILSENIGKIFESRSGERNRNTPYHQVENGCLIDQVVGQLYAHICNLGYLFDPRNIKKTMNSIYHYNFRKELYRHHSTQRVYALNNESGMIICSYPFNDCPEIPMPYINEIMSGFEYQYAAHAIFENMIPTAMKIVKSIRSRYDGFKRSCWDEAECGHHYIRAMASWVLLPAILGFYYNAVEKKIRFDPRIRTQNFSSLFVTPQAWGSYHENNKCCELKIIEGRLTLESFCFSKRFRRSQIRSVFWNAKHIKTVEFENNCIRFNTLKLKASDTLKIIFRCKNA